MFKGYIKLHRQVLDNPIVTKDADHFAVWTYLLLEATHKEQNALFKGEKMILKRGQLITGRKSIANRFNISESKTQRILKLFESEQQIEQQTSNKNRLVTVINYEAYQFNEQQNDEVVNNNRTTSEQQVNTNKNVLNVNNGKNEKKKEYDDFVAWFMKNYMGKKSKKVRDTKLKKIINQHGVEELKRAVERYMKEKKGDDRQFIKHESTWWNGGYIDYLDENYEEIANDQNGNKPRYIPVTRL